MPAIAEPPASVSSPTPPAPIPEINVSQIAPSAPQAPPKPGSERAALHERLQKKAGVTKPEPKAKVEEPKQEEPKGEKETDPKLRSVPKTGESEDDAKDAPKVEQADPTKKEKVSPWKLADHYKERAVKAELRALELEKQLLPEPERQAQSERLTRAEARAKELEDEMRFVNYAKSQEFKEKHQIPYESAWKRAMSELSEITITDPSTQTARAVTANDLMELVNMPLGKARELADTIFGSFADDVMGHRKEIRTLFDQQAQALEEAKTKGAEREQLRKEQYQKMYGTVSSQVKEAWDKINATILEDPKNGEYFKQREGDEDWNSGLKKGFELADRAFSENPMDPRLTPEQRSEIIKRHAAVRNRAAGWGPLKKEVVKLRKQLTEMESELKVYKTSTPAAGGTVPAQDKPTGDSSRDGMLNRLGSLVKRV